MNPRLRPFRAEDTAALHEICILTGNAGTDARAREDDPDLLAQIFVAPYLRFAPDCAVVAEDADGICGYALGVVDTTAFNIWAASDHFPDLRRRRPDPGPDPASWKGSDWLRHWIHHPPGSLPAALKDWPAHGHIDLLPRAQGKGLGKPLMNEVMSVLANKGARGLHLGVDPRNARALRFYETLGFTTVPDEPSDGAIFVVRALT